MRFKKAQKSNRHLLLHALSSMSRVRTLCDDFIVVSQSIDVFVVHMQHRTYVSHTKYVDEFKWASVLTSIA